MTDVIWMEELAEVDLGEPANHHYASSAHSVTRVPTGAALGLPGTAGLHSVPVPAPEEQVAAVYRYAARHGVDDPVQPADSLGLTVDEVRYCIEELLRHRLLRRDRSDAGRLLAVDPEVAAMALVSPMEREIYQRRELIAQVHQRTELFRTDFLGARPAVGPVSAPRVTGELEVRGYVKLAGDSCQHEVVMMQGGKQDTEEFDDFLQLCQQLLERGVAVRIVCQHRSRADLTTRMKIKRVCDAGAQVRTASHIPRTAMVFDASLAVLLGTDEAGEVTADRVTGDGMIDFLLDVFAHLWDNATAVDTRETGYAEVADDLQHTIVALMAKGYTDEVLARKLGMSVRTCRRHIASLMRELDAVSRFQAGVQAGRRQLVDA